MTSKYMPHAALIHSMLEDGHSFEAVVKYLQQTYGLKGDKGGVYVWYRRWKRRVEIRRGDMSSTTVKKSESELRQQEGNDAKEHKKNIEKSSEKSSEKSVETKQKIDRMKKLEILKAASKKEEDSDRVMTKGSSKSL